MEFYILVLLIVNAQYALSCGPYGLSQCVQKVDEFEWNICLPSDYLDIKTGTECVGGDTTCWRNCMNVVYGLNSSPLPMCTCPGSDAKVEPTVPNNCYGEIDGTKLEYWVNNCAMNYTLGCNTTLLTFFSKLGHIYSNNTSLFEDNDDISSLFQCVLLQLSILILPWFKGRCGDQESITNSVLPTCAGTPSLCSINTTDHYMFFWTILNSDKSFNEPLTFYFNSFTECDNYSINTESVVTIKISISAAFFEDNKNINDTVKKVVDGLSETQQWNDSGVMWFGFLKSNDDNPLIMIVLASAKTYDLNRPSAPVVKLNSETSKLADAVKNSHYFHTVSGRQFQILTLSKCTDVSCKSNEELAALPNKKVSKCWV